MCLWNVSGSTSLCELVPVPNVRLSLLLFHLQPPSQSLPMLRCGARKTHFPPVTLRIPRH